MTRRCFWLAAAVLMAGAAGAVGQPAIAQSPTTSQAALAGGTQPAARVPVVVLERSEMLAGERVPVRLIFPDPMAAPAVTQLCVQLLGPRYLTLESETEADRAAPGCAPSALGPFRVEGPLEFSLIVGPKLREGKVAIVFDLAFEEGRPRRVGVEKTIDLGVFGIGSISGVPLQLAVLILPGVAALGVARVFGVGWVTALQTLDAGALSFGVSAILASGFDLLVGIGSSAVRVLLLIGLGLALGCLFAIASSIARRRERANAAAALEASTIAPQDDFGTAVAKALRLNAGRLDPKQKTVVRLEDGRRLEGSLTVPTLEGGVALLGWGAVEAEAKSHAVLAKMLAERRWDALGEQLAMALATKQASVKLLERVRIYDAQRAPTEEGRTAMVRVAAADYSAEERQRTGNRDTGQIPIRAVTLRS